MTIDEMLTFGCRTRCGNSTGRYSAEMAGNADSLIKEIDDCAISPMLHAATRSLYHHILIRDALQAQVLAAFDDGSQPHDMDVLRAAIWKRIDRSSIENQAWLRLLLGLTLPDEIVDWYLAELMIFWARQEGVSEQHIIGAFHS